MVEPLPHQITAVYDSMLARQPLRFLLADDPGAGKTIMAGLLMKELIARGDLQRCLVVCPGSLAEQWQDELYMRFHLPFDILTNDKLEAARTGNWFLGTSRVPHLSRFFERWVRAAVIRLSLVKEVTLIFNYLDSPITTLACDRRP
jgi:SNF2 family DNA or RNA helicase